MERQIPNAGTPIGSIPPRWNGPHGVPNWRLNLRTIPPTADPPGAQAGAARSLAPPISSSLTTESVRNMFGLMAAAVLPERRAPRLLRPALAALALAILIAGASSAEAAESAGACARSSPCTVRQFAREVLRTCDASLPNIGSPTFSDGVVQRREMTFRLPNGADTEFVIDWRRFYAKIDGHGGKRDRKGQFSEVVRWVRSFDRNHNGRLSGKEDPKGILFLGDHPLVRTYERPIRT